MTLVISQSNHCCHTVALCVVIKSDHCTSGGVLSAGIRIHSPTTARSSLVLRSLVVARSLALCIGEQAGAFPCSHKGAHHMGVRRTRANRGIPTQLPASNPSVEWMLVTRPLIPRTSLL